MRQSHSRPPPAENVLLGFIAPDTRVLVGIQLRRILDSPPGRSLTSGSGKFSAPELAGLDLTRDVDELLIATNAEGDNPPGLMVLLGRFHPARAKSYHNVPIVEASAAGASREHTASRRSALRFECCLAWSGLADKDEEAASSPVKAHG